MTREELLKHIRPLEWREMIGIRRTTYKADQFIDGYAFISEVFPKWITSFDNVEYNTLKEAMQAADEYRTSKLMSNFNLEEK